MSQYNSRLELNRELVKWRKGRLKYREDKRHTEYCKIFYRVSGGQEGNEQHETEASLKR